REAALGELPEETEIPERTVNPEELPYGFLFPEDSNRDWPLHAKADLKRRELTQAPARARAQAPRLLGESATLLGWVMPQAGGAGVPLISDSSEDYAVVKQLLTEHYAAFERNSDEDEVDDTDPTQKDFLFGALLREMGALGRHDSLLSTLYHSLALASEKT